MIEGASQRGRRARERWALTIVVAVLVIAPAGCRSGEGAEAEVPPPDAELSHLVTSMTGWFDSREQAMAAPDDYRHVRLVQFRIWGERTDGAWMYVEQAMANALDRPYRQRVYHLHRDDDGILVSDVYALPGDPLAFAAAWERDGAFDGVTPDDLERREGCSIRLQRISVRGFEGGTVGTGCASALGDAVYATSEVRIADRRIESWDRGWDADGNQVWGATAGPYVFIQRGLGSPAPASFGPVPSRRTRHHWWS